MPESFYFLLPDSGKQRYNNRNSRFVQRKDEYTMAEEEKVTAVAEEATSMADYEKELEASFKRIDEGDIISGTVVSVDESGVVLDLKFYAEGFIPVEEFSRVPGVNIKEAVQPGDEVQAMVLRRDDGQGNILLSRADAADVLAWDRLKELQDSGEVLDVVVKGIVNGGAIAYVEGVRGFIPASRLALLRILRCF